MLYLILLAVLSAIERYIQPETLALDQSIDLAINLLAFLGLIGVTIWVLASARIWQARRTLLISRLLIGAVLGPLVAVVTITAIAQDVDGASWMIFLPGLGLLFFILGAQWRPFF